MNSTSNERARGGLRWLVAAGAVILVFMAAYAYAAARGTTAPANPGSSTLAAAGAQGTPAGGGAQPACACCGSSAPTKDGVTGEAANGAATLDGDVQRISVDLSKGYYDPNVITLKAGVPAEITFGQSAGCTAQVISQDLGFSEDLTGGPRTVSLPALEKGTYAFSCGMQMVFGKIVVE